MKNSILLSSLFFLISILTGCKSEHDGKIIGVKIYEHPGPYEQLFDRWNEMGINTGFCGEGLISNQEFMRNAREKGISTFVIFPVFFNPEAIEESPHLAAIMKNGEPAKEEWVEFACPSNEDYRRQVVEHARQIVREHQPDGISIDFIRHFVYWEKVYPDRDPATLPHSCFDSVCLAHFQAEEDLLIPESLTTLPEKADWILDKHEGLWISWRGRLITSMATEIAKAAREEKADILVNIHLVPWATDDFDGALLNVAGQDIQALSELADYLSPMAYSHMLKQPPAWVHHIVEDFNAQSKTKILPSVQVAKAYLDTAFGTEEFVACIEAALQTPSSGVVIWSWDHLVANEEKTDLFKDIVRSR